MRTTHRGGQGQEADPVQVAPTEERGECRHCEAPIVASQKAKRWEHEHDGSIYCPGARGEVNKARPRKRTGRPLAGHGTSAAGFTSPGTSS